MEWPRTIVGTLRCPCGQPGQLYVCIEGGYAGYCSEECYEFGRAFDHPVPVFEVTPVAITEVILRS